MTFILKIPKEIQAEIAEKAKRKRLALNLTQVGLAERSGVSLGTLKRFESTNQISLACLLKLALVLDSLADFENLFSAYTAPTITLDTLIAQSKERKRGRKT